MTTRRQFLGYLSGLGALGLFPPVAQSATSVIKRSVPSSGELLPAIGMGSWLTFDVAYNAERIATRAEVLKTFFALGGAMVDSSPMYGSSEQVIGHCLSQIKNDQALFSATKVWTRSKERGIRKMQESAKLWRLDGFDLMQIHNMLDWETHVETLKQWKADGRIRYIGITTSHGRRHEAMEQALLTGDFDFVQLTYNIEDREAEQRLLPLAAERGIAVIINRPFQRGGLFAEVSGKPLPAWAAEFDCQNWAQFFLKFIISHPAVTCAIPATSRVDHMVENMGAAVGQLPSVRRREEMIRWYNHL